MLWSRRYVLVENNTMLYKSDVNEIFTANILTLPDLSSPQLPMRKVASTAAIHVKSQNSDNVRDVTNFFLAVMKLSK
ncbi:hypothetical protein BHM03_00047260 [Ensete ventricosum]|nr:hypothetical protein BHM03_00047260 [Ensete ventricosum]